MFITYLFLIPVKFILNFIFNIQFLIFMIVWSIFSYFVMKKIFRLIKKYQNVDDDIKRKYNNFIRKDWEHWSFNKLLLGMILIAWIKIPLVLMGILVTWLSIKITTRGKTLETADNELKLKTKKIATYAGIAFQLFCGIIVSEENIDIDYSPYLGNDYKKENITPAATICNHVSWLDIIILMGRTGCGFITNHTVKSFPFVGTICTWIGSLYVNRLDKENRAETMNNLNTKMKDIVDKKEVFELAIFPEGTTSNGRYILPFKKGAFSNFYALKPLVIKIDSENKISLAMDIIEMVVHLIIVCCVPINNVKIYSLPVFEPNEYFKNTYIKENNPKNNPEWIVYAETMRKIMIEVGNFEKGNQTYEDKFKLLSILRKPKIESKKLE